MNQHLAACIFDLDGVIVDTAKYHYQSWVRVAKMLGFEFPIEENEKLKGINRRASLDIVLAYGDVIRDDNEREKLCYLKNQWYLESIENLNSSDALAGVVDLLDELRSNGIKIALGSASKNAKQVLKSLELTDYFDAIVDGNDVKNSKPHPEVFLTGAEHLETSPEQTLVFEDAEKGLEAAIAGGFHTIAIGTDQTLQIADKIYPDFTDINLSEIINAFSFSNNRALPQV